MAQSIRIAKIFGISIELHFLFILVMVGIGVLSILSGYLESFFLILSLFASVLAHELCHSWVAIRNGVKVSKITLLPIGGVASMEEFSVDPRVELKMSVAGPLFNFFVVAVLSLTLYLVEPLSFLLENTLMMSFIWANFILGTFNMIPAIPLDGGRILRSILAMRYKDTLKATRISTDLSTFVTMILIFVGIVMYNIWIMIIAVFVYIGSAMELEGAIAKEFLSKVKVRDIMSRKGEKFKPDETLSQVLNKMIKDHMLWGIVEEKGKTGVIDLSMIASVPRESWPRKKVGGVARSAVFLSPDDPADKALLSMAKGKFHVLPVVDKKKVAGFVTKLDLERYLELMKVKRGLI